MTQKAAQLGDTIPPMNADTFGMWIKARRKQLDLTQEALAERIGCSLSTIRKIEKDERRPSRQIAELLALHLEVPPEERPLFLQIARGDGNLRRLGSASIPTGKLVAVTESFSPASNIPASATPFIGRQQESDSLARMLTDPRQRLITILGPGGIGKTRLAMEAANLQLAAFDQRVYFIQLTASQTVDSIMPAIAATLNIPSTNANELKTRLIDYLRDKKALLVLDNFEHLLEGALALSEILQGAPQVKLLVTSRERLNLQGEWTFELGGLTVPPQADDGRAVYSALQLFELHARRLRPDLSLIGAEREAAIRICQRVDGMPLAIELAAAWVNVLSCEEIAEEIQRGFDFLSSTLRDTPERHRSLRAAFEHSWKRLTGAEQSALSRLTIFQGGFSLEAAEAVIGVGRTVLSSLESKSLLHRSALESLWMLYDVHGWLSDGLEQTGELIDALRVEADAQIYLGRALTFHGMLIFRAGDYMRARNAYEEGIKLLREAGGTKHLPPALIFNGIVVSMMGDFLSARRLMDEGVELAKEHSDRWFLALGQFDQGFIAGQEGNLEYAYERMQVGLSLWRGLGNSRFIAFALNFLSPIAIQLGRLDDAQAYLEESLLLGTQIHDRWGMGTAIGRLGGLALLKKDLPLAKTMLEKSLDLFTDLGARWDIAWALTQLGKAAIASGAWEEAEDLLKRAVTLSLEAEAMPQAIDAALELAECLIQRGEFEKAAELVLPAMGHPASTDSAKQRAVKLGEIIAQKMGGVEKIMEGKTMGEVMARYIG